MTWKITIIEHPPFGQPVLVWCRIYGFYVGAYMQIEDTDWGNWSDGENTGVLPPVCWMPLPEVPTIKE